jgi:hypothetical protein
LIADGPGRDYLRSRCPHDRAVSSWCAFEGRPLDNNNTILWSKNARSGSFQLADYDLRVRLIDEQPAFILAVLRAYPARVIGTALANAAALLFNYHVGEVLEDNAASWRDPRFAVFSRILPGTEACRTDAAACRSRLSSHWVDPLLGATSLMGALALAVLLARSPALRARWGAPVVVLLLGLVLNAAICGIISGDAERYQSRLLWLLPFFAMMMMFDRSRRTGADAPRHADAMARP